jgi:hypothetical protein
MPAARAIRDGSGLAVDVFVVLMASGGSWHRTHD